MTLDDGITLGMSCAGSCREVLTSMLIPAWWIHGESGGLKYLYFMRLNSHVGDISYKIDLIFKILISVVGVRYALCCTTMTEHIHIIIISVQEVDNGEVTKV